MVWQREIGSGYSSFACVSGRLYTCGTQDKKQVLFCLDAGTGAVIWQTPIEEEYSNNFGSGPRATPTVDGGFVYILGARGRLLCVDAKYGKPVWDHRFSHMPQWGYSGSVLIDGKLAIASGGKDDGALSAFDKRTGKPVWKVGERPAGYATPYPFDLNGRRYVVGFTGESAVIVNLQNGEPALEIPWQTSYRVNASSPIFHDGHLFLTSGYSTGSALFKLRPDGEKIAADEVWRSNVIMNKFQSCILYDGKLYTSDQKALVCADFLTGKEAWRVPRLGSSLARHGTLVLAGDTLLLLTEKGELQMARPNPRTYEPISKAQILSGKCWTVPILCDGKLYARNMERIVCFNLTGQPSGKSE